MTMIEDEIRAAMLVMLQTHCGIPEAVEVTGFNQFEATGGACPTCYWSEIRVAIAYTDTNGNNDTYEYHGDMAALIRTLTEVTA